MGLFLGESSRRSIKHIQQAHSLVLPSLAPFITRRGMVQLGAACCRNRRASSALHPFPFAGSAFRVRFFLVVVIVLQITGSVLLLMRY